MTRDNSGLFWSINRKLKSTKITHKSDRRFRSYVPYTHSFHLSFYFHFIYLWAISCRLNHSMHFSGVPVKVIVTRSMDHACRVCSVVFSARKISPLSHVGHSSSPPVDVPARPADSFLWRTTCVSAQYDVRMLNTVTNLFYFSVFSQDISDVFVDK